VTDIRRLSRGGFTLLELLLVLLLISLASALVYPNLQPHLQRTRREAALRKITATLDDLRRRAVASGKVLVLTFDEERGDLLLREEGSGKEPEALSVPEGEKIASMSPALLRYFPQGHSSGAVLMTDEGRGVSYRIEVGSFTGLARVARDDER
jgi:general secretion pathway protein H